MKKENDEIVDLFRSRLTDAKLPVRSEIWDSLEKEIPAVIHRRHRHIMYRFAAAASVLLVLVGSSAAFWYFSPKEEIADAFIQVAVSSIPKGNINSDAVIVDLPAINKTAVQPSIVPHKNKGSNQQIIENEEESISVSFSMSFSFSSSNQSNNNRTVSEISRELENLYSGESNQGERNRDEEKNATEAITTLNNRDNKKWAVGVSASTGLKQSDKGISHKMPLSLGLTVQRDLSKKVALESGIVYTQLNSDFEINNITSHQKLHYIGIPIKANISLYETNRLNLYASGGGMIEKCISGGSDAFQSSLSAGIGLQYKLNNRLSLYTEPGLTYHFDDGSSMNTLRSEKPLNMNLLCGIRMTY